MGKVDSLTSKKHIQENVTKQRSVKAVERSAPAWSQRSLRKRLFISELDLWVAMLGPGPSVKRVEANIYTAEEYR